LTDPAPREPRQLGHPPEETVTMLVLSRRVGETVVLPQQGVTVTVLAVQGRAVRLGVAAPPQVPVHRQEVRDARRPQPPAPPADAPSA
jgi:carbon storage regulator